MVFPGCNMGPTLAGTTIGQSGAHHATPPLVKDLCTVPHYCDIVNRAALWLDTW
jgi:hypothetical protein